MARRRFVGFVIGLAALAMRCSLVTSLDGLTGGASDGGAADVGAGSDSSTLDAGGGADATPDAGDDAATCDCTGLVSAYTFADSSRLGADAFGHNDMTQVAGSPVQSTVVPPGLAGDSIELDGASSVCIDSGFTFDSTSDHTLCWWSQPTALSDSTNELAQACSYDTWTTSGGADYEWRINNCNDGGTYNLDVPGVFTAGAWVQICQTYVKATSTRTVVVDGKTSQKVSQSDAAPILETSAPWCIGSYSGSGGFWTGRIFLPMWFDRVLGDDEIANISAKTCCLP